jgi:glycosyltransferase involved in cell wall biosynthesis
VTEETGRHARRQRVLAFQGSRTGRSAFALVNARWSKGLSATGEYSIIDYDSQAPTAPDVLIHHDFESHFPEFQPPRGASSVAVRTWDFGPLPRAWADTINAEYRQYWAHTEWIAQQAKAAGIDPDRIRVVPHGVDRHVFTPDGPRYDLPTKKRQAFLFVGGMSFRKGTDVLLKAWRKAFTASDDVVLVLKDHSNDFFYRDDTVRRALADLKADPGAAEVIHIDGFLPETDLAALYRACDVAVFPYRAEGFCIPILECMASGTPAIVPRFGACLDFCSHDTSYFIDAKRIRVPVQRRLTVALGFTDEVDEVDFCEVPVDALADRLRDAASTSEHERAERSAAGVRVAHDRFTWDHAVAVVRRCLAELVPPSERTV